MGRSLALALYLAATARGGSDDAPPHPPRPQGPLLWLHAGPGAVLPGLARLSGQLHRERPDLSLLVTAEGVEAPDLAGFPQGTLADRMPVDRKRAITHFLDHWRPDFFVLAGSRLPPAQIVALHERRVPMIVADLRLDARKGGRWSWRRRMEASLLSRFRLIMAQDPATAAALEGKVGAATLQVVGRIEESTEPLPCTEAEREALAAQLRARPVWLAMAVPATEEEAVIAAHARAMQLAHRILLIIVPAEADRAPALAERIAREDWLVAVRARDEEPEPDVQVLIADGQTELGLWYRLAPVTYMGGTLEPGHSGRNPFEPAALGSAILYGPHAGPYPDAYSRLAAAQAARLVRDAPALADAVGELIAADKAATLAHNAWATSSGAAEVTERVTQAILQALVSTPEAASGSAA